MRGRPDVDMRMPSAAHPGDDVPIEILLDVASRTPIDFVDLTWTGEEIFSVLAEGEQRSGVGGVLNTSLNGPRQPIAGSATDALAFFLAHPVDALVASDLLITHPQDRSLP